VTSEGPGHHNSVPDARAPDPGVHTGDQRAAGSFDRVRTGSAAGLGGSPLSRILTTVGGAKAIAAIIVLITALTYLEAAVGKLASDLARRARENEVVQWLTTARVLGPLIATPIAVMAPPMSRSVGKLAAWPELTPRSTLPTAISASATLRERGAPCGGCRSSGPSEPETPRRGPPKHLARGADGTQADEAVASRAGEQVGADRLSIDESTSPTKSPIAFNHRGVEHGSPCSRRRPL
jgi:hypothetical protein